MSKGKVEEPMTDAVGKINNDLLRLQALLDVMDIASVGFEEQRKDKSTFVWWGGLYSLAKGLVESTLENVSDIETYFKKERIQ